MNDVENIRAWRMDEQRAIRVVFAMIMARPSKTHNAKLQVFCVPPKA